MQTKAPKLGQKLHTAASGKGKVVKKDLLKDQETKKRRPERRDTEEQVERVLDDFLSDLIAMTLFLLDGLIRMAGSADRTVGSKQGITKIYATPFRWQRVM